MKKCIVILAIFVNGIFCIGVSAQSWWDNHFIIGTMFDPPIESLAGAQNSFQRAIDAGFNLFSGDVQQHCNCNALDLYATIAQNKVPDSMFFFVPRGHLELPIGNYDGRFFMDEPEGNQDKDTIKNALYNYGENKLCYVNLLPFYGFDSWNSFSGYLDEYCDLPLPVLSFDNYYQHSCFRNASECEGKLYYSNLAEMRRRAGNRPLWSCVYTTDWVTERDTAWQRSYLRLGAFAPAAYGAKGIMCYSYDCMEPQRVIRDLDYRTQTHWDESVYYRIAESYTGSREVFFGNFYAKSPGDHPDIAIKTDEQEGTWYIKQTNDVEGGNNQWTFSNYGYGTSDYTVPLVVRDNAHDMIATLVADGRFLLAAGNATWTCTTYLPGFTLSIYTLLDRYRVAAGETDGVTGFELCMAWADTLRVYSNYNKQSKSFVSGYADTVAPGIIRQVFTCRRDTTVGLYAVCSDAANSNWKLLTYNSGAWSARPLSGRLAEADHFWVEERPDSTILCMALRNETIADGGSIYSGKIDTGSGAVAVTDFWADNSVYIYKPYGVRNKNGGYDLYCLPVDSYHRNGVIDGHQRETVRYRYMSDVNHYLRQRLAPVIMNSTWQGCYHAVPLPDATDSHIQVVNGSTPVIRKMNANLMAGLFEAADSVKYLMLVNKSDSTLAEASVWLRGNAYEVISMLPRIDTGDTTYVSTFNTDSISRQVTWLQMTGGECVVLKLRRAKDYFVRHRNSFFDGDRLADINYRFNSEIWKIDLASNGFGTFDASYPGYGNDTNTYPILADYSGDGITDLSLLRYQATRELLIDKSDNGFGSWDIQHSLNCGQVMPYIGLFNNDDLTDFAYVVEDSTRLHMCYASCFETSYTNDGYGTSSNTMPAVGDYDGDGYDDLATYRYWVDSSQLIDYYAEGGIVGWNTTTALNYINGSDRYKIQVVVSDYDGDGKADFAYFDPRDMTWNIDLTCNGIGGKDIEKSLSTSADNMQVRAVATDYDGDGMADMSLYLYGDGSLIVYYWLSKEKYSSRREVSYDLSLTVSLQNKKSRYEKGMFVLASAVQHYIGGSRVRV